MRKKVVIFAAVIVVIAAVLIGWDIANRSGNRSAQSSSQTSVASASSGSASGSSKSGKVDKNGKTLIVYFSRTNGVYNGPLKIGNTKRVADFIQRKTGGDEYEIVPVKDYPSSYEATTRVAQQEQNDNARPKIKNKLPDVSGYDNVFVGAPVWWGEYPMVVRTFLDGVNLNGKHVIPFTTHEGSGLGNTPETLRRQYPKADVLRGLGVRGSDAANSQGAVDRWLTRLGY
ncbi:MAG: flavodoxin [Oenococcus sp.]|uniref:flavodoxin n=1 Tax=Oenococcus sp. TaxID=1979414 RepID=UPI0039E80098